jgi:uncharacterized membrane protein YphA (DoxX/SURF4 family)
MSQDHASTLSFSSFPLRAAALLIRIMIGWHFLYEGMVKLLDPRWSSGPYLMQSRWLLSDFFHWMAQNPAVLQVVDYLNIWGLILIGSALILGIFTRVACFTGVLLLGLYYVANPPFGAYGFGISEGHYLFVNKTLIEMAALVLLGLFPAEALIGLDRLFAGRRRVNEAEARPEATETVPVQENSFEFGLGAMANRRELLKNLTVFPVFGGFVLAGLKRHGWGSYEEANLSQVDAMSQASRITASASSLNDLKALAPKGSIGDIQLSRLICGGNLISGFAHARDLIYVSSLLKSYFDDEKVIETLWLCESSGINTAILRTDEDTIRIMKEYWRRGGKIQWLAQTYPKEEDISGNINKALETGAIGAFVMGNIADKFVKDGRVDLVDQAVSHIKNQGVIAGCAAHSIKTIKTVEEAGVATDFYMKTLHHTNYWSSRREDQTDDVITNADDNYWEMTPEKTIGYMKNISKPWIAYKVLAAGAIAPKDGFKYSFENGADFACVGMFDFQIVDNVNTLTKIFSEELQRTRPWYA